MGAYKEGRDGGGEVLGDGGRAARAGSGSRGGGPGRARAAAVRLRAGSGSSGEERLGLGRRGATGGGEQGGKEDLAKF